MRDVGLGEAARVWARIALLSFGGPAGQIAVMHRILAEEKRWIGEARFLHEGRRSTLIATLIVCLAGCANSRLPL